MTRNFAELERELINDLKPRTGRTLAEWMAAIKDAALTDKNEIIDWLRPQGFTFANASWLERIHNNGGRPIYLGQDEIGAAVKAAPPSGTINRFLSPSVKPGHSRPGTAAPTPPAPLRAPAEPRAPAQPGPSGDGSQPLAALLAKGKAFRPLAEMLLREVERALPGTRTDVCGDLVVLARPAIYAALLIGPRELKLALALEDQPAAGPFARSKIPGAPPTLTHTMALNDARQIAPELLAQLKSSDLRSNPQVA